MTKKQIKAAKNFLSAQRGNDGFSKDQYDAYDDFSEQLQWAWETWDNAAYFNGKRPEWPTEEFKEDYICNIDESELESIIEAFGF